jgi:DNA-binding transcriptional LysR family regulator
VRLELRHLALVRTLAEEGSISAAAARLGLAQPGLTAQLRRIERELGGRLFDRGPGGIELTELGRYVAGAARDQLDLFDQLLAASSVLAGGDAEPAAPVRVGGTHPVLTPFLAVAVRGLLPDRTVWSRTEPAPAVVLDLLAGGGLDLAALEEAGLPAAPAGDLTVRTLFVEPGFIALPAGHALAGQPELELAALAEESWAAPPRERAGRRRLELACAAAGFAPRVVHETADGPAALALAAAGLAVCWTSPAGPAPPQVVRRPLAGNPLRSPVALVWRTETALAGLGEHAIPRVREAYVAAARSSGTFRSWLARHGDTFGFGPGLR